jgi:hypothetical protein
MMAVGNDPAPALAAVERGTDDAGRARVKLRHGVVEMREAAQAFCNGVGDLS